jgi:hypothetical protein
MGLKRTDEFRQDAVRKEFRNCPDKVHLVIFMPLLYFRLVEICCVWRALIKGHVRPHRGVELDPIVGDPFYFEPSIARRRLQSNLPKGQKLASSVF